MSTATSLLPYTLPRRSGPGSIRVVSPASLPPEGLVVDAGFMGAPTVGLEKLDSHQAEAAAMGERWPMDPPGYFRRCLGGDRCFRPPHGPQHQNPSIWFLKKTKSCGRRKQPAKPVGPLEAANTGLASSVCLVHSQAH